MASTFKTIGCGYNLKTGHPITFHMEHIRGYHLGSYKVGQTCPLTIDTEEPPPPTSQTSWPQSWSPGIARQALLLTSLWEKGRTMGIPSHRGKKKWFVMRSEHMKLLNIPGPPNPILSTALQNLRKISDLHLSQSRRWNAFQQGMLQIEARRTFCIACKTGIPPQLRHLPPPPPHYAWTSQWGRWMYGMQKPIGMRHRQTSGGVIYDNILLSHQSSKVHFLALPKLQHTTSGMYPIGT